MGPVIISRLLQWAICEDIVCTLEEHGVDTMDVVWKAGKWDWWQLLLGEFDENDLWGEAHPADSDRANMAHNKIMGDFIAALMQLRSDLDWMHKVLFFHLS